MLMVRYDQEADIMTIDTAPNIRIAVSSSVDFGLVADFGSEDGYDVVGVEIHSVGKLLAPFCALTNADAIRAQKAVAKFSIKYGYDKEADVLSIKTGYDPVSSSDCGGGLIAHFGYWDPTCAADSYDVVGIELRNASECLGPWFILNRSPLPGAARIDAAAPADANSPPHCRLS